MSVSSDVRRAVGYLTLPTSVLDAWLLRSTPGLIIRGVHVFIPGFYNVLWSGRGSKFLFRALGAGVLGSSVPGQKP